MFQHSLCLLFNMHYHNSRCVSLYRAGCDISTDIDAPTNACRGRGVSSSVFSGWTERGQHGRVSTPMAGGYFGAHMLAQWTIKNGYDERVKVEITNEREMGRAGKKAETITAAERLVHFELFQRFFFPSLRVCLSSVPFGADADIIFAHFGSFWLLCALSALSKEPCSRMHPAPQLLRSHSKIKK